MMKQKLKVGMNTNSKTVLYIDQDCFKILSRDSDSKKEEILVTAKQIKNFSEHAIAEEIKKTLKKPPKNLILSLPRHSITVKNFTIPSIKNNEISSMIEYQVLKMAPYPRNEIIFDHKLIKELPNQCSLVRVAVIHRKTIEQYLSILEKANLTPNSIQFGTEITPKAFSDTETPYAVLEIDFHQSHIIYLEQNQIIYSRSISLGLRDLNSIDESNNKISEFLSELEASVSLFPVERDKKLDLMFITGADEAINILEELISKRLGVQTKRYNLDSFIDRTSKENNVKPFSFFHLISIFQASPAPHEINLLPPDIRFVFEKKTLFNAIKKLSAIFLVLISLFAFAFFYEITLDKNYLSSLNKKISTIEKNALEIEKLKNKVFYLKNLMDQRGFCLDIITSLISSFPDDVFLKNLSYDGKRIVLRGYASNLTKIFELTSVLEKNVNFDKVETKYARQASSGASGFAEFHLECVIRNSFSLTGQNDKKTQT